MLLYKTAPNLEESLESALIDDEFKSLASDIQQEEIYQLISDLNKTQQEMRWTNHPKVFLEVAIVKLCQLETSPIAKSQSVDINQLTNKINQLENELRELKKHRVSYPCTITIPQIWELHFLTEKKTWHYMSMRNPYLERLTTL